MTEQGIIAAALTEQGAAYPMCGADLVLRALKAAGYAVVELPKPTLHTGLTNATWDVGNLTVETMGDNVLWPTGYTKTPGVHTHNGCQAEWARHLAAALLAAADAAEAS